MRAIDFAGFEEKFRADIDPWDYQHSSFERKKRELLVKACGYAKRGRGLEVGCANGETTRCLAPLCLTLTALDGSPTAIAEARRRVGDTARVRFVQAILPEQMPAGPFDLIVASEIAYYLSPHALQRLARRFAEALAPGGRIVLLHHRRLFSDAAQYPAAAHERLCRFFRNTMHLAVCASYPRFNLAAFDKNKLRYRGGAVTPL
jgi:SAM-dependent methyltransferase